MAKRPTPKKSKSAKKPDFLSGDFNLPKLEEEVLKFWDSQKIFEKSLEKNRVPKTSGKKSKQFVFYEGPPTANGRPGVHHILARSFKDLIPRYKTMQGYYVPRKGGWDTHGLPVELQVEKSLGLKSKKEIEKYGIAAFNEKCRESVWEFKDEWERMTKRMGYWIDLKNPYITYETSYMETLWWIIAQFWKREMLYKGHRVVPWCTRCGTALSSHELAQGYKEVVDRSVYVKFHLKAGQKFGKYETKSSAYILSWTTTPWTLPGNVALAVGEKISYTALRVVGVKELYILAHDLVKKVFPNQEIEIVHDDIKGKDLLGLEYESLFEVAPLKSPNSYKIYPADFVTTTDGTGVVHTAVMYGEDDYELGKKIGLPQHHTVDETGKFTKDVPALVGEYAKSRQTEDDIFAHLEKNGNLLRIEDYKHEYPFCWRCGTAILYYARTSWFVAMSRLRKELLKQNETIGWTPEYFKEGRFGEWLRDAKDWNFSRERYWGTPLPIWECAACHRTEVVDSVATLAEHSATPANNHYWAVRHGESENITFHIIDSGNQNFRLTERGKRQVMKTAKDLKKEKIDMIFASDLLRTKTSAEIIAKEIGIKKIIFDKRLHEIDLGSLSGMPSAEYGKHLPTQEERFAGRAVPEAESLRDVRARAWSFLRDMEEKYKGKNILIVSHEDTIWMLSEIAFGWSEQETAEKKTDNRGVFMAPAEIRDVTPLSLPRDKTGLTDLHKPFIDDIALKCPKCKKKMKRVREVADVWFDSGSMPFAQNHFPFGLPATALAKPQSAIGYPADYISEAVDQTRGWFYTLLAVATALGYDAPYKNVVCLGHINDKNGQKMSKSKGNIVDPWMVMNTYGVDALRWYFYSATPPGEPKNFDEQELGKVMRRVHLIVYNSFVFWKTYADHAARLKDDVGSAGKGADTGSASKNILDTWILARLNELTISLTKKLDTYQIREAALEIESFIDDLSRWYIRRSRKRLQRPDDKKDYADASATLHFVLLQLSKLMAPFTPFFAEILYSGLGTAESVHLEDWPASLTVVKSNAKSNTNKKLVDQMKVVRELATLGLAKRAEVGIKVRQPLAMLRVPKTKGQAIDDKALLAILADEVNVKKIFVDPILKDGVELDTNITQELREEGWLRDVARMVQELRQKAGLEPKDRIAIMMQLPDSVRVAIEKNEAALKSDVGAKSIEYKHSEKFTAEESTKMEGRDAWIGIRKI